MLGHRPFMVVDSLETILIIDPRRPSGIPDNFHSWVYLGYINGNLFRLDRFYLR
jgi:hypothetical protein